MRNIIFRGKRVDTGEWIEGDLLTHKIVVDKSFAMKYPRISIHNAYDRGLLVVDAYDVISKTIGQFTGLTDKNGKRIFEGDIVRVLTNKHNYHEGEKLLDLVVTIEEKGLFLHYEFANNRDVFVAPYNLSMNEQHWQIIGNIHDKE